LKFHGRIDFSSLDITKCLAEVAIIKRLFSFAASTHIGAIITAFPFSLLQNCEVNAASTWVYALSFPFLSFHLAKHFSAGRRKERGNERRNHDQRNSKLQT